MMSDPKRSCMPVKKLISVTIITWRTKFVSGRAFLAEFLSSQLHHHPRFNNENSAYAQQASSYHYELDRNRHEEFFFELLIQELSFINQYHGGKRHNCRRHITLRYPCGHVVERLRIDKKLRDYLPVTFELPVADSVVRRAGQKSKSKFRV